MKKILTSVIGVMSVIAVANAEPYVGLNFMYNNLSLNKINFSRIISTSDIIKRNEFGGSIDAGYQFSDYFGAEAYFQYNLPSSMEYSERRVADKLYGKVAAKSLETKTNFMSGGLDILGYLPLNDSHSLNLVGTIGGGYYRFETKLTEGAHSLKIHENHLAARMGVGVQYNINESFAVRALGRYVMWKHDSNEGLTGKALTKGDIDLMKGMWEATLGVQYKF